MASRGGFERSIDRSCDEYHEHLCVSCSDEERNVEAINFCVECDEYFCVKCVKSHHKYGKMKTHQILDKAKMKTTMGQKQAATPLTERCELHHGNTLDTFCAKHDAVCCSTCVSLFHKLCEGMEYLPTAAVGILKSKEFKDVKSSIQDIELQISKIKTIRQDELKSLESDKTTILAQIKDFRKRVMKRLEELEKMATDELQAKYMKFQNQINADIKCLEEMLISMETKRKKLETAYAANASQIFVFVKSGKQSETAGKKLLHEMKSSAYDRALQFRLNSNVDSFMKNQKSLGEFLDGDQVLSASLYGEFDMTCGTDKQTCDISGSCMLDNGTVLVVDFTNKRLKRLGGSYQVRDYCDLPGSPFAVCATGPQEVAVTLFNHQKIQFVSVGDKLTLTRSFRVQCKYDYCKGVAYANNHLFVSCGGLFNSTRALQVYNMSGTLQKTIEQDQTTGQKMFCNPQHITVSRDQTKIHIADDENGLITLDIHGNKLAQFTDPDLTGARGVCVGNKDDILVCGCDSGNIIKISRDGRKLGVVLGEADGVKKPQSLCWDGANSRLIVTMNNTNLIKVFDM